MQEETTLNQQALVHQCELLI